MKKICIFAAVIGVICFVLTNAIGFAVIAWVGFISGAIMHTKAKKHSSEAFFIAAAVLSALPTLYFSLFLLFPMMLPSGVVWKYPFQKAYLSVYGNIKEPEWFPDFTEDVKSDYLFAYMPSLMQGSGYYSVSFKTTPQAAEKYKNEFEPQAAYIFKVDSGYLGEIVSGKLDLKEGETLTVNLEKEFWNNCGPNTKTYVLYDNFNWNHPHSAVVIIDMDSGRIQMVGNG